MSSHNITRIIKSGRAGSKNESPEVQARLSVFDTFLCLTKHDTDENRGSNNDKHDNISENAIMTDVDVNNVTNNNTNPNNRKTLIVEQSPPIEKSSEAEKSVATSASPSHHDEDRIVKSSSSVMVGDSSEKSELVQRLRIFDDFMVLVPPNRLQQCLAAAEDEVDKEMETTGTPPWHMPEALVEAKSSTKRTKKEMLAKLYALSQRKSARRDINHDQSHSTSTSKQPQLNFSPSANSTDGSLQREADLIMKKCLMEMVHGKTDESNVLIKF